MIRVVEKLQQIRGERREQRMRFAVADDLAADLESAKTHLRQYIETAFPVGMKNFELDTFPNAEELLKNFSPGKYDLMILDIFMEDMTGMEAAEAIRLQDEKVPIVFLTTSQDFMLEGYRVFAAGYLMKPLEEHVEDFNRTMNHILPSLVKEEKGIPAVIDGEAVEIPLGRIVYADINTRHKLTFHLMDIEVETSMAYVQCQELLLTKRNFTECYHRIIINMDYVHRMEEDDFVMKDGTRLPISQRRKKETKAVYMHYLVHR